MAEIITPDVLWKVGERGNQVFHLYDSDNETPHNGTGHTYTFRIWDESVEPNVLKGGGLLSAVDAVNGIYQYPVTATDTDTEAEYLGEVIEDFGSVPKHTNTFKVKVEKSSTGL